MPRSRNPASNEERLRQCLIEGDAECERSRTSVRNPKQLVHRSDVHFHLRLAQDRFAAIKDDFRLFGRKKPTEPFWVIVRTKDQKFMTMHFECLGNRLHL